MAHPLSELTLEGLWELFPIILTEHRAEWLDFYLEMETKLKRAFAIFPIVRISHIGSTAIPVILAKFMALRIKCTTCIFVAPRIMMNAIPEKRTQPGKSPLSRLCF